ncbi:hypothetical protein L9F63_007826, partial [Diploptera punctata]
DPECSIPLILKMLLMISCANVKTVKGRSMKEAEWASSDTTQREKSSIPPLKSSLVKENSNPILILNTSVAVAQSVWNAAHEGRP